MGNRGVGNLGGAVVGWMPNRYRTTLADVEIDVVVARTRCDHDLKIGAPRGIRFSESVGRAKNDACQVLSCPVSGLKHGARSDRSE